MPLTISSFVCVSVCIYACECRSLQRLEEGVESLKLVLQAPVSCLPWVLGPELQSSASAASALKCRAIAPAQVIFLFDPDCQRSCQMACYHRGKHSNRVTFRLSLWNLERMDSLHLGQNRAGQHIRGAEKVRVQVDFISTNLF